MLFGILTPFLLGLMAFLDLLGNPEFHAIRNINVVRLMAVGWCWGIAFSGIALLIRSKFRKA